MQLGNLRVVEAPAVEPVTVDEVKEQARIDLDAEDTLLRGFIIAARQWAEKFCRRAFVLQTVDYTLNEFPSCWLELPGGEVREVVSVSYYDTDGVLQVWDELEYNVDLSGEPARLEPASGYAFPATQGRSGAVIVRYKVGYAEGQGSPTDYAENVPEPIKLAISMMVAHWSEHRETVTDGTVSEVPLAAESLLWPYRILWG